GSADAVVLGNQIQHVVFAVKASSTKKDSIKDAMRRLRNAGIAPMGVVLTHARNEHSSDYAYESYYGYGDDHTPRAANPQHAPGAQPAPLAASTRTEPKLGPTTTAEA
ncbi:MAG: hypothetical protein Q7W29_00325, partial [bacterium]|nr:hypothetical protein [bacterium]